MAYFYDAKFYLNTNKTKLFSFSEYNASLLGFFIQFMRKGTGMQCIVLDAQYTGIHIIVVAYKLRNLGL